MKNILGCCLGIILLGSPAYAGGAKPTGEYHDEGGDVSYDFTKKRVSVVDTQCKILSLKQRSIANFKLTMQCETLDSPDPSLVKVEETIIAVGRHSITVTDDRGHSMILRNKW
jgi:hypothetical protein